MMMDSLEDDTCVLGALLLMSHPFVWSNRCGNGAGARHREGPRPGCSLRCAGDSYRPAHRRHSSPSLPIARVHIYSRRFSRAFISSRSKERDSKTV